MGKAAGVGMAINAVSAGLPGVVKPCAPGIYLASVTEMTGLGVTDLANAGYRGHVYKAANGTKEFNVLGAAVRRGYPTPDQLPVNQAEGIAS